MEERPRASVKLGISLRLSGRPVVREKFGEPGDGMSTEAGQHVIEPGEGIDSYTLAGCHEGP